MSLSTLFPTNEYDKGISVDAAQAKVDMVADRGQLQGSIWALRSAHNTSGIANFGRPFSNGS